MTEPNWQEINIESLNDVEYYLKRLQDNIMRVHCNTNEIYCMFHNILDTKLKEQLSKVYEVIKEYTNIDITEEEFMQLIGDWNDRNIKRFNDES